MKEQTINVIEMAERVREARKELERLYRSKPRKCSMIDRFCKVMNNSQYGMVLAKEVLQYRGLVAPAMRQLRHDFNRIQKLSEALRDDPWICKSRKRIFEWEQHYQLQTEVADNYFS